MSGDLPVLYVPVVKHPWKNGGDNTRPPQISLGVGLVKIMSDMDCDADGSPRAPEIDPGYGNVATSLSKDSGWKGPSAFVNSENVPFIVLPLNFGKEALGGLTPSLGCLCHVMYGNYSCFAIYADEGPETLIGEGSIALIEALGGNPWDSTGKKVVSGLPAAVQYTLFPTLRNLEVCVSFDSIQKFGQEQTNLKVNIAKKPGGGPTTNAGWPSDGLIPFAKQMTKRMKTHGAYQGGNASGIVLHHSAGKAGTGIMSYGLQQGYAYLAIDRDGTIFQAHDIREWGYHAGNSAWRGLEGGVTDDLIGIEVITAGQLEVVNGKKYPWWAFDDNGKLVRPDDFIPDSECVFCDHTDEDEAKGWYQKTTPAQEVAIRKLVPWLLVRCRKAICVSHYECATPKGRKNDLMGATFTMTELRDELRAQGIPALP